MQYPAPWTLSGKGIVIAHGVSRAWRARHFSGWHGPIAMSMWVDYTESPVGPYREWLLIPGRADNVRGRHFSISHIYVDSHKSLIGGRENWGIPKQMGQLRFDAGDGRVDAQLSVGDTRLSVGGRIVGPSLPVGNRWCPVSLYQQRDGHQYWTAPRVAGRCRWLRLDAAEHVGQAFGNLGTERVLAAFYAEQFRMTFLPADIVGATAG